MSMFEMYLLTRLMHLEGLSIPFFIIGGIFAVLSVVLLCTSYFTEDGYKRDAEGNKVGLSKVERLQSGFKKTLTFGIVSLFIASLFQVASINSNTEVAVIIAVPFAMEMMDADSVGEEVGEWNDIMQAMTMKLLDGEDMETVLREGVTEGVNTENDTD